MEAVAILYGEMPRKLIHVFAGNENRQAERKDDKERIDAEFLVFLKLGLPDPARLDESVDDNEQPENGRHDPPAQQAR